MIEIILEPKLVDAVNTGDLQTIKEYHALDMMINTPDRTSRRTLLYHAIMKNNFDIVHFLIKNGADIDPKYCRLHEAYEYARSHRYINIMNYIDKITEKRAAKARSEYIVTTIQDVMTALAAVAVACGIAVFVITPIVEAF